MLALDLGINEHDVLIENKESNHAKFKLIIRGTKIGMANHNLESLLL